MVNFGYLSTYLRTGWRVTTATHTLFSPYVKINFFLIQVECDGILIGFSFKLLILLFGTWALFHRGSRGARATMPRIHLFRAALSLLLFIFVFAFWLFYGVRVFNEQKRRLSYLEVVGYANSMVDTLLFIHYLALILLEIKHLSPQ